MNKALEIIAIALLASAATLFGASALVSLGHPMNAALYATGAGLCLAFARYARFK